MRLGYPKMRNKRKYCYQSHRIGIRRRSRRRPRRKRRRGRYKANGFWRDITAIQRMEQKVEEWIRWEEEEDDKEKEEKE